MHEKLLGKVLKIDSYFGINSRWQKIPVNRVLFFRGMNKMSVDCL